MRRSLVQSARSASSVAYRTSATTATRVPFVCAHCRRIAQQEPALASTVKSFSTSAKRHQQAPPQREFIAPQTHYELFPNTFPAGPPPDSPFTPDLKSLRKEFLQLQAKTHPDLAPAAQKRRAEAVSSRVNEAYKTLQDPLRRAQYLLSLQGIDVEDESAKLEESELLMEVMEAREAVDDVENEEDLTEIRDTNNERIEQSVGLLSEAFATQDMERAAREAVRLRYWMNIEESIQGWEKGVGGGLVHH